MQGEETTSRACRVGRGDGRDGCRSDRSSIWEVLQLQAKELGFIQQVTRATRAEIRMKGTAGGSFRAVSSACIHSWDGPYCKDIAGQWCSRAVPPKVPFGAGEEPVRKASCHKSELTCVDHRLSKSRTWQIFWVGINLPVPTVNTIILFPVWFRECNCHAHDLFENILPAYVNEWGSQRAFKQEVRALTMVPGTPSH